MVKAISYVLTDAIYNFIYSSGGTIRRKLDILTSIIAIVRGILEDNEEIMRIQERVDKLIEKYEPAIDYDGFAFKKANAMNAEIYDVFADIVTLITDYDLLELKVVQEIYARMWGDRQ